MLLFRFLLLQPSQEQPLEPGPFPHTDETRARLRKSYAGICTDKLYKPFGWNDAGTAKAAGIKGKTLDNVLPAFLNSLFPMRILSQLEAAKLAAGEEAALITNLRAISLLEINAVS